MDGYKWTLSKRSKKYVCPNCQHLTFTPFVRTDTNGSDNEIWAGDEFGRCDRENECAYFSAPTVENGGYFSDTETNTNTTIHTPVKRAFRPQARPLNELFIKNEIFQSLEAKNDPSNNVLLKAFGYFDEYAKYCDLAQSIKDYNVMAVNSDYVIYWQIDTKNKKRAAKLMYYTPDGHRVKDGKGPAVKWLHKIAPDSYTGTDLRQCFFGQHLLNSYPKGKPVCIVESEKTAILMRTVPARMGEPVLYLATGGSNNLAKLLENEHDCLKGRHVFVFPDVGCYDLWSSIIKNYKEIAAIDIRSQFNDLKEGDDMADHFIKTYKNKDE